MTNEATKTKAKFGALEEKIFCGTGIDIGCGDDPIYENARPFDVEHGDANRISNYITEKFDYVFSSHCLEHMCNPYRAIQEWWKLVKLNGYMYIVVPDEDLYEQGVFPSRWNQDHKCTFTIYKDKSWCYFSVNVIDLVKSLPGSRFVKLALQDDGYNYNITGIDQTYIENNMHAMAQIVFALQKTKSVDRTLTGYFSEIRYDIRLILYEVSSNLKGLNIFLGFIKEKFTSEKYSGIWGKTHFFFRGFWWVSSKLRQRYLKSYHIIPANIEAIARHVIKYLSSIFIRKKEMDLLLIQPNGLGDAILNKAYTDIIINYNNVSSERILILASDAWKGFEQVLWKNLPVYFFSINKFERNLFYRFKIYYFIMKYNFNIALCNLRWRSQIINDGLLFYVNSKKTYCTLFHERHKYLNESLKMWCNKMHIYVIDTHIKKNEINRLAFFYKAIFNMDMCLTPVRTILKRPIGKNPIFFDDAKYIVFHIGVSDKRRRWPIEKFIAVGDHFLKRGYKVVFSGGQQEKDLQDKIEDRFLCYIDLLSPYEYTILLADASAVLSGDTGPAHLAIALNTPTAIILGGGHFGNYFPYPEDIEPSINKVVYIYKLKDCYYCDWECSQPSKFSCIHDICTEYAINSIDQILNSCVGDLFKNYKVSSKHCNLAIKITDDGCST